MLWRHIGRSHILRRRSLRLHLRSRCLHRGYWILPGWRRLTRHALWHRRSSRCTLNRHTPTSGWLSCRWRSLSDPDRSLGTKAWLQVLPMNHHGCSLFSSTKAAKFLVMRSHTHVDIIHHFCKDDTFTAVFLHNDIQHNFVSKVVALCINKHIGCAVVTTPSWSFHFDLQFEKFIWSHIVLYLQALLVEFLIASNQHKLQTLWNFDCASVLKGPHILDFVIGLEHTVLFQRLMVEFCHVLRLRLCS